MSDAYFTIGRDMTMIDGLIMEDGNGMQVRAMCFSFSFFVFIFIFNILTDNVLPLFKELENNSLKNVDNMDDFLKYQ